MKRVILKATDLIYLKANLDCNNTHIYNSYRLKKSSDMVNFLERLRELYPEDKNLAIHKRGLFSMTTEWEAHNLLYKLNIQKNRTKDVDLNVDEPWYRKLGYIILSFFY